MRTKVLRFLVIWAAAIFAVIFYCLLTVNAQNERLVTELEELAAGNQDPGNGIMGHGRLGVQNRQLVDEQGTAVQLRGMSSHGMAWYSEYSNYRALVSTKEWGANLFRVAMNADNDSGGYSQSSNSKRSLKSALHSAIENVLAADMYVLADWHILSNGDPNALVQEAMEFFDDLSMRYANEPGVLYEICNEPNGDVTWMDIKQYADQIIPVIRKNSPKAVIIVGTPNYSSDILSVLEAPLEYDNIMYSYHLYTGKSTGHFYKVLDTAIAGNLPVFVTEWGISTDAETGELDVAEAYAFIDYMKINKISWANWSLSNKAEDYSAIKNDCKKLSNWTEDDLTISGKLIFHAFSDDEN